jgi:hypothetical protein
MRQVMIRIRRGIAGALRSRPGVFVSIAMGVFALDLFLPPAVLSIVRKPADYFAFNAWLPQLPTYLLRGDVSAQQKLEFIPNLALFWFSADSPFGGVDWGFAVTVGDLLRVLLCRCCSVCTLRWCSTIETKRLPQARARVSAAAAALRVRWRACWASRPAAVR